jgi:outer membrane scaffolding protein for murein synthesis (MipA/OmpV family)
LVSPDALAQIFQLHLWVRQSATNVSARYQMTFDLSVDFYLSLQSPRPEKRLNASRRQSAQSVFGLSALAGYLWFIRLNVSQFGR